MSDAARAVDDPLDELDQDATGQTFRRLMGGTVDVVADSVRDAFERSDSPGEMAREFRRAEEEVAMLAQFAETLAEDDNDE